MRMRVLPNIRIVDRSRTRLLPLEVRQEEPRLEPIQGQSFQAKTMRHTSKQETAAA